MELVALASLALVAGVVSFTAPCTLPLLPGYVAYVSDLSLGGHSDGSSGRRVWAGALLFAAGFTLVFTVMGASATAMGWFLARNAVWFERVAGGIIIVMGLVFAGALPLPGLGRERRLDLHRFGRGPQSALPLGAAFALGWTPCVGPVLASILLTAGTQTTVGRGALLLAVYSAGLTLPFLWVAAGVHRGAVRMGWLRRNSRRIELAGGLLLVAMGIAIATGGWALLMSRMLSWYARLGWPPI